MSGQRVAWILDSGGAGRGAWQGGVLYEFMSWARANGRYPDVSMGASAGGYAAGDVATGTEQTVMKGWTAWGKEDLAARYSSAAGSDRKRPRSRFRRHLRASLGYVMAESEVHGVFDSSPAVKLLIFTTRVRRRDGESMRGPDLGRLFLQPILPDQLACDGLPAFPGDSRAVFIDGGYALKMPMAIFEEESRFRPLAAWARTDKTVVFCCDPSGSMWETSSRLRRLNSHPVVARALADKRMLLIYPDHKVEAGFLCLENARTMRTFERGREQGRRLLGTDSVRRFLES
jgi:hypothetical protein